MRLNGAHINSEISFVHVYNDSLIYVVSLIELFQKMSRHDPQVAL